MINCSYLVSPLMDLDLNNIIKVQKLTDDQVDRPGFEGRISFRTISNKNNCLTINLHSLKSKNWFRQSVLQPVHSLCKYIETADYLQFMDLFPHQVKFIIYQIMRGLKYIHSAGIIHRF